jgi:hypothetical protein
MTIPGVQIPHCAPPSSMNARCSGNTFDRRDGRSVGLQHRHQTAVDEFTVDDDGARAAFTFAAPFLRASKMQVLPEHVEKSRHRMCSNDRVAAVDLEADFDDRRLRHG